MRARTRALTGISLAAVLTASLTAGTATADDPGEAARKAAEAARRAAYQASLDAGKATPVTAAEVAKFAETALFKARAAQLGLSQPKIDELLSSGEWVGVPLETTLVTAGQDVDPETQPEQSETEAATQAPAQNEVTDAETVTPDDAVATNDDGSPEPLASKVRCYTGNGPTVTVKAKNVAGKVLWYYQVGERYCYNGKSITSRDSQPYVNHKIYTWAQVLGWSWEGQDLSGKKGPSYYKWRGNSKGGLKTWRKGEMKYSPVKVPIGGLQKFPWVHLYERADGSYKYSAGM
ncbi:hypothetical protein [Streptomyces sp. SP18BB07]|uniref:hypothetical protein n=1 Tax=Streptomyces sp. SP18BB07 TaxID=3002522 RepID=UPI002E76BBBF|nr:hypothetical protein [Streptomyces sp. SP18BB07]MEE1761837.1 hypothetical protein [Streptomyces sp. SP18BB07]